MSLKTKGLRPRKAHNFVMMGIVPSKASISHSIVIYWIPLFDLLCAELQLQVYNGHGPDIKDAPS